MNKLNSIPSFTMRTVLSLTFVCMALLIGGCNTMSAKTDQSDNRLSELEADTGMPHGTGQPPVATPAEAVRQGNKAMAAGEQEKALLYYIQAVKLDPKDYRTLYRIGLIHNGLDNLRLASLAFQMALEINEAHAASHEALGLLFLKSRKLASAHDSLEHATVANPTRWRSHNGLGVIADLRGQHSAALQHYEEAIQIAPNSALLWSNLGYSHYLNENLDEAEAAFKRSLAVDPKFRKATYNLALIYARRGDYNRGLRLLTEDGHEAAGYNDLGYLCILQGQYERAREYLNEAIRLSPSYYEKAEQNLLFLEQKTQAARLSYN